MLFNMKRTVLTLAMLAMFAGAYAQTDMEEEIDIDDIVNEMNTASPVRDRFVFNLHWDGWMGAADSIDVGALSRGVGLHFFYDIPMVKSELVSFAIGVGWNNSNYYTKALFVTDTIGNTVPVMFDESQSVQRNKLVLNYLEVPLEFRFRTKPNQKGNSVKVAVGFKGGYQFANHTKYIGDDYLLDQNNQVSFVDGENEIKVKRYRYSNLSSLQYGPTFRIGYGNINLEAYYGLGTIFQDGSGPEGSPLQIGISFNPF